MKRVSTEYKEIMNREIRNKGYISISVGIVNQEAQEDSTFNGNYTYWSDLDFPFGNELVNKVYATMEQNFTKVDGSMLFVPEDNQYAQYIQKRGICTSDILGTASIAFGNEYNIKGLTLNFGEYYPTNFQVITDSSTFTYTNDSSLFTTNDVLGDTTSIQIVPIAMIGGQQRLRINNIKFGVGINFSNNDIESVELTEFVHSVCEELSSIDLSVTVFDTENLFNVDDDNSYVNYLESMQNVSISAGLELDNGSVEYLELGNLFLDDWKSQKGKMTFIAKDRLTFMDDIYSDGNTIHSRTLYADAEAVLISAGLQPDEYEIDECLKDITITNPLPESSHSVCLQLIANAGRCILLQNPSGKICLKANFANVLEPEDMVITSTGESAWSHTQNVLTGSDYAYADMTKNFTSVDGSMYFMPEDDSYLETSFVSAEVADENGNFVTNPTISIELPAGYMYYGIYANFDGNPPQEIVVKTYFNSELQETIAFTDLENENIINHEFIIFDKMVFEFTKASANNRVLVNKISFGDLTDYTLKKDDMLEDPVGYREKKTKKVSVKVFTFQNNSEGNPEQVDDNVYYSHTINSVGQAVIFENRLISTQEHAQTVAEWLGNYYANNVSYEVNYRGDPRIDASDIIFMESDTVSNLQVEVETNKFTFNGSFGGSLELRRALRMIGA